MSLPTPPRYVVLPEEIIEQAYAPDKPRRALLASFARIISLAWESKYQHTPALNIKELQEFLKLSPRQYFEQIADMELLVWLRSTHPKTGFVQFSFSRSISEQLVQEVGAENRTASAENRTDLKRTEEEENLKVKNLESSSILLQQNEVRKTALSENEATMQLLLDNLHLLFDPEQHGLLDVRGELLAGIPDRALGWIAKAYQDRERLTAPIGFIVKHVLERDEPNRYFLNKCTELLPEAYLEAVHEIEYQCGYCAGKFDRRALLDEHVQASHRICMECGEAFDTEELERAHYAAKHHPDRAKPTDPPAIPMPIVLDGNWTAEKAWQAVLGQLQMEMPRASFDTWVRDTEPVRYDGNALEVSTRNAYARDWLTNRLTAVVERLLKTTIGKEIKIKFVVMSDTELIELPAETK